MRCGLVAISLASACGFSIPLGDGVTPDDGDPIGDSDADAPPCDWAARFDACVVTPGDALTLDDAGIYVYDTDTRVFLDPAGDPIVHTSEDRGDLVLASFDEFAINAGSTLRAIGSKPLLVASWSTIVIAGVVDVSATPSASVNKTAAGAHPSACMPAGAGESDVGGSSGGGGGGYGANGGKGGDGDMNMDGGNDGSSLGGSGGVAATDLTALRGGCAGADGGMGGAGTRGLGGAGGGAIELAARTSIMIAGAIRAGGRGGSGVTNDGGGGGGGSGGHIGLDAPTVHAIGILAANGGAGAGGGDDGNVGISGGDGRNDATAAMGGPGGQPGGTQGADGGHKDREAGATVTAFDTGAGGGGGGSTGVIRVRATSWTQTSAVISPSEIHVVP